MFSWVYATFSVIKISLSFYTLCIEQCIVREAIIIHFEKKNMNQNYILVGVNLPIHNVYAVILARTQR